jgi:hypothetical protein
MQRLARRRATQDPKIDGDADAGHHREAERMEKQNRREAENRRKLAYEDADLVILEERQQIDHHGGAA